MARYRSETIASFSAFVDFVQEHCKEDDILFRGQSVDAPLLPKIARLRLREQFRQTERHMFEDFQRRAIPYIDFSPEKDWDWLALAQHHGMATRLLDWTLNPLAALWFTVSMPPKWGAKGRQRRGVVWVFFPERKDFIIPTRGKSPFCIAGTRVFQPRHVASRINAQAGWFTTHSFTTKENKFIPLERNPRYSTKLIKLRIPPKEFQEMRYQLDRLNINAASLFPDLDGLCNHITWDNSLLDDEGR